MRGADGSIYFTDPDYGRWNDWILFTRSTLPTTTAVAEPAAATEKPAAATEEPEEASDGSA